MSALESNVIAQANLPAQIGRFIPSRCLGKGAQGIVYQAHDPDLGRDVAIKTLKRVGTDDQLLKNEARNVSKLQHQGIVPLYEIGHHGETPYLVYRLAEGRSLREMLDTDGAFKELRACQIFMRLLDAMNYAHKQGILHRDLNPNNILIDQEDQPHILDFGVSGVIGTVSHTQEVVGTANYMAPESLSNAEVGPNADIFSLSAILWEMLTGKRLFTANNQMAVIYKIVNEPILPPSTVSKHITAELDAIVMKGLERDPVDRYASAASMKHALEDYLRVEEQEDVTTPGATQGGALEFLMRKINRKPDFPAISQHITEISQKTANIETNDTADLSKIILKDYALTTKLLRLVNSATYGQYGGSITTVSRAVVILGYEQVRMAALSIMLFEHLGNAGQATALKDSACSSFLSGVISRHLAEEHKNVDVEEVFISSMFHRLGKHLTIYYFPDDYAEIEGLINNRGKSEQSATREILGVTYNELGNAIAKEWQLPDNIINSMKPQPAGAVKASKNKEDIVAQISSLSNEISQIVGDSDRADTSEAMEKLCERYKDVLKTSPKKIDTMMKDAVKEVSDYADILQFDVRSSKFFKKVQKDYSPDAELAEAGAGVQQAAGTGSAAQTPATSQQEAMNSAHEQTMLIMTSISEITNSLLGDYEINSIITMVLETIYRGMGFTRVMFCLRDNRNQTLLARFGLGKNIDTVIPQFKCRLSKDSEDVFNHSVFKHKDFVILDVNSAEYKTRIPNWCRELTEPHSMMLFPVVVNKTCIGVIYADNDKQNPRISTETLKHFSTLRNQACLAVQQKHGRR